MAYLDQIILAEGITMDSDKAVALEAWPYSHMAQALHGFLGLTGCYHKFIIGYGGVATPLTAHLKGEGFSWMIEAEAAFVALKATLVSALVLQLLDFSKQFIIDCDMFEAGFGVVLH